MASGCTFKPARAQHVRDFFQKFLRHSKGQWAGKSFELLDWQWNDVIAPLYGWERENGTRRYRKGYIEIPKKNGKSALGSGLSLYMLVGDNEPGAEVYNAAADRDQASIVFTEAANMVEASPALSKRLEVIRSRKQISHRLEKAWYRALSADVPTKEGLNIHFLLFDELHAQRTRDLWDTLIYGGAARRQPLFLSITTAGYDKESICYEQHNYAQSILDGRVNDWSFFAFIAAADVDDDWREEATWRKANPSYGVTIAEDDFRESCREAQESPAKENAFRRYRLDQWTEQDVRAIPMDQWNAAKLEFDPDWLKGEPCWAGLDLASTQDVTALVLCFEHDDRYIWLPFFWVPENAAKDRERRNKTRFDQWIRTGAMMKTPGDMTDYNFIRQKLNELRDVYDIREVAYDPWNGRQLAIDLVEQDGFNMVEFRQGYPSMTEPTKQLLGMLASGKLAHPDNPCLNWMAGNFAVEADAAGNLKPSKKKSTEKIDGIVAGIMGMGRMLIAPQQTEPSVMAW